MQIRQLSRRFFVTGQITVDDLGAIVERGFDHLINNRPDGEAAGQPKSDDLATAVADEQLQVTCRESNHRHADIQKSK